jgi:hypothetical protein
VGRKDDSQGGPWCWAKDYHVAGGAGGTAPPAPGPGRAPARPCATAHGSWSNRDVPALSALLAASLALAFQEGAPTEPPPHAQTAVDAQMRESAARVRHPSDGGGRARLREGGAVAAGARGRWVIEFEAGPLGVAEGGAVYLQVSPFWNWSTPQTADPRRDGFTVVTSDVAGLALAPATIDQQLLAVELRGRGLAAGERVTFEYGAGPAGARADTYAEACSRFWIAVDGDGDGVRAVLADSPCVEVRPGPPARLVLHAPGVLRPGEELRLTAALLDRAANAVREASGRWTLRLEGSGAEALAGELALEQGGAWELRLPAPAEGVHRARLALELAGGTLEAESNPFEVSARAPRIRWADLHGHSADSDGTGTPADYFRYARDVAGLDAAALTDHDHWGLVFLDETPELWSANVAAARAATRPGRFLALPGYEWTSWLWGHRHVVFPGAETPLLSSIDPAWDTPAELAQGLAPSGALAIPHHPAGGPIAVDWNSACRSEVECVVELASAHGASEAADVAHPIYSAVPGTWVRSALSRGVTPGFVASGDGHDGHPGLAHLGPEYQSGGVAAILCEELDGPALLDALRARRCYATSGPRAILRVALGRARMGERIAASALGAGEVLFVSYSGTDVVRDVTIVRSGAALPPMPGDGTRDVRLTGELEGLEAGEWIYVRVTQNDGHAAWSSPIWIE